jgi:GNAT superfamily N-acetyltransferase
VADLRFVDIGPGDDTCLHRWYDELVAVVAAADRPGDVLPGYAAWAGQLQHPATDTDNRLVVAEVDGELVGWFGQWMSTRENTDTSPGEIEVHPDHRRRGYGRAMLAEWRRRAEQLGRKRIILEGSVSTGAAFATALGFRGVLADTQRRLDLTALDTEKMDALRADAEEHSTGYSLVRWVGRTPEEHLRAVAALESRMTTDAPMDDLVWEQEVFDADRLRDKEQVDEARLLRKYTTGAVQDGSQELVGFTTLTVFHEADEGAYQWQTIVSPDHRGHRLGMLLKLANIDHLRPYEPAARTIDTWNADSNAPMLRVNLAMGFEVVRQWSEYELVL